MQTCIFHWIPGKDPFRKSVFKYRLREWISIYLKLLYGSIHSSRVATFFTSTCLFSSRGRLFPFISNFSMGSLSEIPWESGIRTRFSFRNLWRKKRKSCRNFCEVHSEVKSSDLVTLYLLGLCLHFPFRFPSAPSNSHFSLTLVCSKNYESF